MQGVAKKTLITLEEVGKNSFKVRYWGKGLINNSDEEGEEEEDNDDDEDED